MDVVKILKRNFFTKCLVVLLIVLMMLMAEIPLGIIITCVVAIIICSIIDIVGIRIPLLKTGQALKDECALEEMDDDLPLMKDVKMLVKKCSEMETKKNLMEIYDKQAEIAALQSQINPHFLYNTLESVRGQALIDGNIEIAKMMEALAAFFRYCISKKGTVVTLREELSSIENYMMIQRYRFNNRFSLEIYVDEEDEEAYDYLIPKMIIQPVVENAIFHGLEEMLEGGTVTIEIIRTEENLIITVSDNGKGMDQESLKQLNRQIHGEWGINSEKKRNTGIALPNIQKRIQLLFGDEYGVSVYSTYKQGTDVEITVPIQNRRAVE